MRALLIVIPGLAERPLQALDGKTPLEAADHPALDALATRGRLGTVDLTVPGASPSAVTGLPALLGWEAASLDLRRGPLEAAGLGVELAPDDLALRLNFVSTFEGALADTRAGHVSDREAELLLEVLRSPDVLPSGWRLHAGAGYRHLLVIPGGALHSLETVAPHVVLGQPLAAHLPHGRDAMPLRQFIEAAWAKLRPHEVNRVRVDLGENPADAVWPWGEGSACHLPRTAGPFGGNVAVVAAAPLVRGLAALAGFVAPHVAGTTADERSDLAAKVPVAIGLAADHALTIVHAAAVNEASRSGDAKRKVAQIERVDRELVAPLLAWVAAAPHERRLLVTSDHTTAVETRASAGGPVPFGLWGAGLAGVRERRFTEASALAADLQLASAGALLGWFAKPIGRGAGA
ncbi:MAG: hypothetical protein JNL90_03330 [Planctomycetes bacterium]|nr:hypothetical protein [Planctomycetota bacterium]